MTEEDSTLAGEIDNEISENERVLDTVQALESLLETVAVLPEDLSETDQALIRSNLQMAVTGTDIEAVEFAPGMESFTTRSIAMEGIEDTILNAIYGVFNSNDKVLSKTQQRYVMFETQVRVIDSKIEKIRRDIRKAAADSGSDVSIFLGKHIKGEKGIVTSKEDFFKSYYADTKILRTLLSNVVKASPAIDGMLKGTLASFRSIGTYYSAMQNNYKKVRNEFLGAIAKDGIFKKTYSDADLDSYSTQALLGMTRANVYISKTEDIKDISSALVAKSIRSLDFTFTTDNIDPVVWQRRKVTFAKFTVKEVENFINDIEMTQKEILEFCRSEARAIKNRRNFLRNLNKSYWTFVTGVVGLKASVVGGITAGATTGLFTKSATKSLLATSLVAGVGGGVTGRLAPKIGSTIGGLETSVQGFVIGLLSNSLRLQNKITKFYNNATNGVAEAMTDHVNLGYGVVKRAVNTFDEE